MQLDVVNILNVARIDACSHLHHWFRLAIANHILAEGQDRHVVASVLYGHIASLTFVFTLSRVLTLLIHLVG